MRILVTGATGFIGARLLARLAVECDDLVVLRREGSSVEAIKNIKFTEVIGDVTDIDAVRKAVQGCDYVFHVAASVSYWDKLKKKQYETNVIGTRNVVTACIESKVKRLVHTSSVVAIGYKDGGALANENTEYNLAPHKIGYCDSKREAEAEVLSGVRKGLDAVIVSPGAVFGAGDLRRYKGNLYGGRVWIHRFYVGGGISTVDVDDVVEGHIRAWRDGKIGERYILSNENLTFKEISEIIGDELGWPKPTVKIPTVVVFTVAFLATVFSRLTRTKPAVTIPLAKFTRVKLFYSNEKARRELGMTFKPLRESIKNAVVWYRQRGLL